MRTGSGGSGHGSGAIPSSSNFVDSGTLLPTVT